MPPTAAPRATSPTILLSIKPHYAELIEQGRKVVEFRRRFPRQMAGAARVLFYVTSPRRQFRLVGEIDHVQRDTPDALWRDFGRLAGVARDEFDAYFAGRDQGVALLLRRIRRLATPVNLSSARLRAIGFKPPQSLLVLAADSPLLRFLP
jgi:predicted transcriptional regulator